MAPPLLTEIGSSGLPVLGEQDRKAHPGRHAAASVAERHIDIHPLLAGGPGDRARGAVWPAPVGRVVGVAPGQDLFDGQWRSGSLRVRGRTTGRRANRSDAPTGRPRRPWRSDWSIECQSSPGAAMTGPAQLSGQRPVAWRCISAHIRTLATVSRRRCSGRRCVSSLASDVPPGRPRKPFRRAMSMFFQSSPGASGTPPDRPLGHWPWVAWCASAQARIWISVRWGRAFGLRVPRCSASSRASDEPAVRPRRPKSNERLIAPHDSPGAASTAPDSSTGQRPWAAWCASAQAEDLLDRQVRAAVESRTAAILDQHTGQGRRAGQAATALEQGRVDRTPALSGCTMDRPRLEVGPAAKGRVMGVGPGQDLLEGQPWDRMHVPRAPVLGEQPGERRSSRQAAATLTEVVVEAPPTLPVLTWDRARHPGGPAALGSHDRRRPRPGSARPSAPT